ncbi:Pr6Pr family membrane protein [Rhizobium sp. CNPSo 4039]|uniref:Pr6Pr family membrane protein n=1 Tax=Rhizobium sp. CNPSo 4039 TaxID=3021409 RepID=UPI00254DE968|nr:Pr6Pr family membrane protein [Rhizobium sp. CNPSo 4039]MDK4716495.1 Pr6Pr family membrane protein [Rhizobium sp. CNPSo 4039]
MAGMIRVYRYLLALLALSGIAISYFAIIPGGHVSRLTMTVNFFSYFTMQSNLLLAMTLLCAQIAPLSSIGKWASKPSVRSALLLYVGIAGIVYFLMLRDVWHPRGWQLFGDQILHYCVPLLYAADWIFLSERGRLSWRDVLWWLAFPAAYSAYTLAHGYISRFYPYPFLDVRDIGLEAVLLNMGLLATAFLVMRGMLTFLDWVGAWQRVFRRA